MRDKLIIIATIQYIIKQMKELLLDAGRGKTSLEKQGVLKGLSACLLQIHFAITNEPWNHSPKELMEWMIRYMKTEATKMGGGNIIEVAKN